MGILQDLSSDGLRFALKVEEDPNSGLKNDTLKSIDEKIRVSYRIYFKATRSAFPSQNATDRTRIMED